MESLNNNLDNKDILARNIQLFNKPVEVGIRALVLLKELYPMASDIQRLIYYDYLLLHSGDVEGGPPSLHPATPHRSCEILVRRKLMQTGLLLLQSKGLAKKGFESSGITYLCTEMAEPFLGYFSSEYSQQLKEKAKWVIRRFGSASDEDIEGFIKSNLGRWGSEFTRESLVRGGYDEQVRILSE